MKRSHQDTTAARMWEKVPRKPREERSPNDVVRKPTIKAGAMVHCYHWWLKVQKDKKEGKTNSNNNNSSKTNAEPPQPLQSAMSTASACADAGTGWGDRQTDLPQVRNDSPLSWAPEPPVSSLLLRFIECNILIKNTHTSPLWCIKRFLAKHSNVAINFPPSTLTSNNSNPSILYLMFILMAAFQKEKGKRGKIYSTTLPIAISLMFSIKFRANWETNTWKKKGRKQAHLGKI